VVLALSIAPSLWAWVTRPWPPPWFANAAESGEGGRHAGPDPAEEQR